MAPARKASIYFDRRSLGTIQIDEFGVVGHQAHAAMGSLMAQISYGALAQAVFIGAGIDYGMEQDIALDSVSILSPALEFRKVMPARSSGQPLRLR